MYGGVPSTQKWSFDTCFAFTEDSKDAITEMVFTFQDGDIFSSNAVKLKMRLAEFFESRPDDFHCRGTDKLVQCWQDVMNNEGEYID